jgi:RNA polymerase sigma-70 factor (ECF subfamily)
MDFKDDKNPSKPSIILPFPAEKHQSRLSITIDDADMGTFYREYYSLVYYRCLAMLGNEEDAQDMVHDVFAEIQERTTKGLPAIDYPKTYLSTAAKNMSINKIKRAKRERDEARRELFEVYEMATNGSIERFKDKGEQERELWRKDLAGNGYEQVEAEIIIKAILDEQDETTRTIYIYKYHDDMTLEQIGEAVGLRKSAVQKRIKKLEGQVRAAWGNSDQ